MLPLFLNLGRLILNMAKQAGNIIVTGTIDHLCFYQMDGRFYVRIKSSLSGKRVKTDPAFAGTMRYASLLATAAKIASGLYRALPPEKKAMGVYRVLTGKAMRLLKEGHKPDQVVAFLEEILVPEVAVEEASEERQEQKPGRVAGNYPFADAVIAKIPVNAFEDEALLVLKRRCYDPP